MDLGAMWPIAVYASVLPVAQMVNDRKWSGDEGRERLLALDPMAARNVLDAYQFGAPTRRSRRRRAVLRVAALAGLIGYVASVILRWGWAGLAVLSPLFLLGIAAGASRAKVRGHVLAVLDEREDIATREVSRRGRRRSAQILIASGVAFGGAFLAGWAAERWDHAVLWAAMGALLLLSFCLLLGAAWAGSWRYGDEEPA
ncbi:hypothetical protein [Nocardioides zeae]|uniref:Uncharacterized protein n=1 Tax=Nocardioides zeae TaxID=1457234 RepID=A0A6P0HGW1_9ACTN|nr:hypothetical protein [Nocardioides zeae]NEN77949.1 hypothetical protein [Nocardioides zeae]